MNILTRWFVNAKSLSGLRNYAMRMLNDVLLNKNGAIMFYNTPLGIKVFDIIRQHKNNDVIRMKHFEFYNICAMVEKTENIPGDIAEVGVYRGGSARLICETAKNKTIHLFDTFEGLPDLHEKDDQGFFYRGQYAADIESVRAYLKNYQNVHFYKGLFPETAEPVKDKNFSLVHLDVDIYKSTLDCLNFFYPRMSKKGIVISHDYPLSNGVKAAFDEFFKDKPETIIELPGTKQCMITKL